MQLRRIGNLEVSALGLGCNSMGKVVDAAGTERIVHAALDHGITFFDTADVYGDRKGLSEILLGRALRSRRDDAVIATKFGLQVGEDPTHSGSSARWVRQACDDSLRRLGTDRIDLFQIHYLDGTTPIEETVEALGQLVTEGKVRALGHGNMTPEQMDAASRACIADAPFVATQHEWSLLTRTVESNGVLDAARRNRLSVVPYFPLASGLLTGKYRTTGAAADESRLSQAPDAFGRDWMKDSNLAIVERLARVAESHGRTLLELAFGWLLSHDLVGSVIAGATSPDQVSSNAASCDWRLTQKELVEIEDATANSA